MADEPRSQAGGGWPLCPRCGLPTAGLGTALKPAYEPVILARKPLRGTVAANVLREGTGALNIDACRIAHTPGDEGVWGATQNEQPGQGGQTMGAGWAHQPSTRNAAGRWPANVLLDEEAAQQLDAQTGTLTSGALTPKHTDNGKEAGRYGAMTGRRIDQEFGGDTGGPSRFFYTAKASRAERNDGLHHLPAQIGGDWPQAGIKEGARRGSAAQNHHPTVKPVALMRWLCRLVTPPGGVILDPFIGSGSTAVAARAEGFRCWGIDQDAEYLAIAAGRLSQLSLFAGTDEDVA